MAQTVAFADLVATSRAFSSLLADLASRVEAIGEKEFLRRLKVDLGVSSANGAVNKAEIIALMSSPNGHARIQMFIADLVTPAGIAKFATFLE